MSLPAGIYTKRQELWDSVWIALNAAGVDVAEPPGIRNEMHDFVRDGLRMSRYLYTNLQTFRCSFAYCPAPDADSPGGYCRRSKQHPALVSLGL